MAGYIAQEYVRIRPDTSGFKEQTNKQVNDALKGVKRTIAASLGGAGIYEILKSTFEAAAGRQSAGAAVELAVKNARAEWVVYGKTVEEILDQQEHLKGFDFEDEAQAFGRIEQQTKNTKKSLADLSLAMDVSRARHLQLAQVAVALSRLEGGNAQSLSRLGIITDKYTGSQDKLKSQIADVNAALAAQTASHQKNYDGQIKLTAAQQALFGLSKSQLAQRKDDLSAQLAQAAASDKQVTVDRARAEILRRYGGQADTFTKTAAGSLATLHTSIQQLQEAIGTAFLPLISSGAHELGDFANGLAESGQASRVATSAAHDLGQAIDAISGAIHTVEPLLGVLHDVVDAIGVGPITAAVLAWKLLPPVLALAGGAETALSADTVALQGSIDSVGAQLEAFQAQIASVTGAEAGLSVETAGLTTAQAELVAEMDAEIATATALFAAIEEVSGAQLSLASSAELAAAAESSFGVVTAGTIGEHAAATAAIEAQTLATEESVVASRTAAVGLAGMLGPLSLLAGALYFVHERFDKTTDSTATFADQASKLAEAIRKSQTDVGGAKLSQDQAQAQRDVAQTAKDAAATRIRSDQAASTSASQLFKDTTALRTATLNLQAANHAYATSIDAVKQAEADRRAGVAETKRIVGDLTNQIVTLGKESGAAAAFLASHGKSSWLDNLDQHKLDLFLQGLEKLRQTNPALETNIKDLEGIARAAGKVPDRITIALALNPTLSTADLTNQIVAQIQAATTAAQAALSPSGGATLLRGGLAPVKQKTGADFARDFQKAGGVYPAEVKTKVKKAGEAAAADFTTGFVTHIDAGGIADAISSAVADARANISTQSDAVASAIGDALDERLRRTTLPLSNEISRIQRELDAESAANSARDTATALADAQAKLAQLKSVYGSGALTAGQSKEIRDAETAVSDAQQSIADSSKQARIKSLQDQIDAKTKAEELAKTSASRSLADLADSFSRGTISREKYLAGVRSLLGKEQVTFKTAGKLLGSAFADGFQDSLSSLFAQIGVLKPSQLKGSAGTKPTSVSKAGGDALSQLLDQIAGANGRFTLDNASKLPKGLSVPALLSAAKTQRSEEEYRTKTTKQGQDALTYAQQSRDHLATAVALLREGRNVHVTVVDKPAAKKTRNTAKATTS